MTAFVAPTVAWRGTPDTDAPLVVLLHGRGSNETDTITLADQLPGGLAYAAVRAPIPKAADTPCSPTAASAAPVTESLTDTMAWFRAWIDEAAHGRAVVLIGFSGGAAFAGGLFLDDPARWAGAAHPLRGAPV